MSLSDDVKDTYINFAQVARMNKESSVSQRQKIIKLVEKKVER